MTVHGKDVVLYFDDAGTMKPICCARQATLATNADMLETTTFQSGKWKSYQPDALSFSLSCSGLVSFDMNMALAQLRTYQFNFTILNFKFEGFDAAGNSEVYSGKVIVTSVDSPFTYNANFEYSMQAQGSGALQIDIVSGTYFVIDSDLFYVLDSDGGRFFYN